MTGICRNRKIGIGKIGIGETLLSRKVTGGEKLVEGKENEKRRTDS